MNRLIVLTALVVTTIVTAQQPAPPISYQIHSYDDLREWPQVLLKGADWLKVDFYYQPPTFCSSQSHVHDPSLGCFLLNHDAPVSTRNYDTSDDLLSLISEPALAPYFLGYANGPITIAVCGKYTASSGMCDNSPVANDAIALFDKFFAAANALNLGVTFVLDGSFAPSGSSSCFINRWRPWASTWIVGQNPQAAATSDNATLGYDRFAINNMPAGLIPVTYYLEEMQAINYGKFLTGNTNPFLFWEPSDQSPIMDVVTQYMNHAPVHEPNPGFRFAINIDPVQAQVYTSRTTADAGKGGVGAGGAWNIAGLLGVDASGLDTATTGSTTPLAPLASFESNTQVLYVMHSCSLGGGWCYATYNASNSNTPNPSAIGSIETIRPSAPVPYLSSSSSDPIVITSMVVTYAYSGNEVEMLTVFANGTTLVWMADPITGMTAPPRIISTPASSEPIASGAFPTAVAQMYGTAVVIYAWSSPTCALQIAQFDVYSGQMDGTSKCLFSSSASPPTIISTSTSATLLSEGGGLLNSGLVVYATSENEVYASIFTSHAFDGIQNVSSPGLVGIGTDPSVSVIWTSGSSGDGYQAAMIVMGNSYCWNNEIDNKRSQPALCDSTPVSVPYVLSYSYGTMTQWQNVLSATSGNGVSPCSGTEGVMTGVYDWGTAPNVDLYWTGSGINAVAAHTGVPESAPNSHDCGAALPATGLVLDGWLLPSLTPY